MIYSKILFKKNGTLRPELKRILPTLVSNSDRQIPMYKKCLGIRVGTGRRSGIFLNGAKKNIIPTNSIADRHRIDAGPDPDPNFLFDADPYPDPNPTPTFTRVNFLIFLTVY
jgi:hypothetical protein